MNVLEKFLSKITLQELLDSVSTNSKLINLIGITLENQRPKLFNNAIELFLQRMIQLEKTDPTNEDIIFLKKEILKFEGDDLSPNLVKKASTSTKNSPVKSVLTKKSVDLDSCTGPYTRRNISSC